MSKRQYDTYRFLQDISINYEFDNNKQDVRRSKRHARVIDTWLTQPTVTSQLPDARKVGMQRYADAMRPREVNAKELHGKVLTIFDTVAVTAKVNGTERRVSATSYRLPFDVDDSPLYARFALPIEQSDNEQVEIITSKNNTIADGIITIDDTYNRLFFETNAGESYLFCGPDESYQYTTNCLEDLYLIDAMVKHMGKVTTTTPETTVTPVFRSHPVARRVAAAFACIAIGASGAIALEHTDVVSVIQHLP